MLLHIPVQRPNATSIWTFDINTRRIAWPLAFLLFLVACEGDPFSTLGGQNPAFAQIAPQKVSVAGGDITIAGPFGYCIDRSASQDTRRGVFVLLGSCASIANDADAGSPRIPGVLTASVSGESSSDIDGSMARLEAFFLSDSGRAALSRNRRASSVTVLSTRQSRKLFILRVRDTSPNLAQGLSQEYWRALFDVRGRIVTLSVIAFTENPMSDSAGLATLKAFAAKIQRANPPLPDKGNDDNTL